MDELQKIFLARLDIPALLRSCGLALPGWLLESNGVNFLIVVLLLKQGAVRKDAKDSLPTVEGSGGVIVDLICI